MFDFSLNYVLCIVDPKVVCFFLPLPLSLQGEHSPNHTDSMMSFLPLAHMLERLCEVSSPSFKLRPPHTQPYTNNIVV